MDKYFLKKSVVLFSLAVCIGLVGLANAELAGHWQLDGNAADASDNGNNGTLLGSPSFIAGVFGIGQAIDLNGTNQSVSIPHSSTLKPANQITISAWVLPDELNGWRVIYRKDDGDNRHYFAFKPDGANYVLAFGLNISGIYGELLVPIATSNFMDGQWHLITATYDGSFKKIYVDSEEIGEGSASGLIGTAGSSNAYIGSWDGDKELFDGGIDDVRLYSHALSENEIQDLYNNEVVNVILSDGSTIVEEGGTTDSFTVELTGQPDTNVTVDIVPSVNGNDIELVGSTGPGESITLTFETTDWNTPQIVIVQANDDQIFEGNETVTILLITSSVDPRFTADPAATLLVTVIDNDLPEVIVGGIAGLTGVNEQAETQNQYTLVLGYPPLQNVAVCLEDKSDPNQVIIIPQELTFTPNNWNLPQTITLTAIDDADVESDPHYTVIGHTVTSDDINYNKIPVNDVSITIAENDCIAWGCLKGDINEDCYVNLRDIAVIASSWLEYTIPQYSEGDLNGDFHVNMKDLFLMSANWLKCTMPQELECAYSNELELNFPRCEYRVNPLGIDVAEPMLSWILQSHLRSQKQTAYRVLVASSEEKLTVDECDIWDSTKIISDQSIHIVYGGIPLQSGKKYFWKVRVWDKDGEPSDWSQPAMWSMGLLNPGQWHGDWIAWKPNDVWQTEWDVRKAKEEFENLIYSSHDQWFLYNFPDEPYDPAPLLRKEFSLSKSVKEAVVHICGLGYYELYLNGGKVGDHVLDPGWTNYDKRVLYETYDITDQLQSGTNAVGLMLGRGWYNVITDAVWQFHKASWMGQPKAVMQLNIKFTDGSEMEVVTDSSWKVIGGPVIYDDVRSGEAYDAREEKPGWSIPGYDDAEWSSVSIAPAPNGTLRAQMIQPIKVTKTIKPVKMTNPEQGIYVFDLGQNIAGWPRLHINGTGEIGRRVMLRMSSQLLSDGKVDAHAFAYRCQDFNYILKGEANEICEPHFTYYGFRYIQVEGFPYAPTLDSIEGRLVCTSMESAGNFSCSNSLLNQVQQNILWTQLNNMHSIPTDCPNREKLGWTGDAHITAEEAIYNFNCPTLYTKYVNDLMDSQRGDGALPSVAPSYGWGLPYTPAWVGASVIIPWHLYEYYGDKRNLEEHYDSMKLWVGSIEETHGTGKPYIVDGGPGDWLAPHLDTPLAPEGTYMVGTAYYYYCVRLMSQIAQILGMETDAAMYTQLAVNINNALQNEFFDTQNNLYHGNITTAYRQTPNALALFLDIVPAEHRDAVVDGLIGDILNQHDGHLNTGYMGTKALMEILPDIGRADVAYTIASATTYPGWIWPILEYGATTIPEWWDGMVTYDCGGTRNHPTFGCVSSYYYKTLAGIQVDPNGPGFKRIIIKPHIEGGLTWARAEFDSIHGKIISHWSFDDGSLTMNVTIPANTTATVYVPAGNLSVVTESGMPANEADGVSFLKMEDNAAVFEVGSGNYCFLSER